MLHPIFDNQLEISNLFKGLGWGRMITRSGVYTPIRLKSSIQILLRKNNKDLISIKNTVKGVNINLDRTFLSHIASIPNKIRPLPLAPLFVLFSVMMHGIARRVIE